MKKYAKVIGILSIVAIVILVIFPIKKDYSLEEDEKERSFNSNEVSILDIKKREEDMNSLIKHIAFADEALGKFKVESPEKVVELWAEGMTSGNGVLQYALMDNVLKEKFKEYLKDTKNLSWDTRKEDKIINNYEFFEETAVSDKIKIYKVNFTYIDKDESEKLGYNTLTVAYENERWVIASIR